MIILSYTLYMQYVREREGGRERERESRERERERVLRDCAGTKLPMLCCSGSFQSCSQLCVHACALAKGPYRERLAYPGACHMGRISAQSDSCR